MLGQRVIADAVVDGAAAFGGVEDAGAGEQREVTRNDREINGAALGDLADGAAAGAFGDAGDERCAGGVGERAEERGREESVERPGAAGGLLGIGGGAFVAYLRHHASIGAGATLVKDVAKGSTITRCGNG